MKKALFIISLISCTALFSWGQEVWMMPNLGQWDDRIEYKVELQMGEMLIEKDGFTYFLHDGKQHSSHSHEENSEHTVQDDNMFHAHVFRSKFLGSSWNGVSTKETSSDFYYNYFQGSDPSSWKSEVYGTSMLTLSDFYNGIDLVLDGKDGLKYSLLVDPNTSLEDVVMRYEGHDRLFVDGDGNLHITNRFGELMEKRPVAWEVHGDQKRPVNVEFSLSGDSVRFVFPNGYDATKQLVIDPTLVFSTFTGSTANNWGMTATPDDDGNLFGGGIAFAAGYPVTAGAYDASYNGGAAAGNLPGFDIAISKFSSDGTALLYSTYVGGTSNELPTSMYCSDNGELYVLGITGSGDFPMTAGAYDNSYAGGPNTTQNFLYFTGSDLCVFRLNSTGTALLSSTYVGGTGLDGLNSSTLDYNYGDSFRGEIVLDDAGNVFVASTTRSGDFPTSGSLGGGLSGAQDAVAFEMNGALTTMLWSGYFGGSGDETGNSIQVASTGTVYMAGGTSSSNVPFSSGYDVTYGGDRDGYVVRLNGTNGGIMSGTLMGAGEYEQAYFVQLDIDDYVYVLGQSESDMGITPTHYGNPNAGQYIRKYTSDLMNMEWGTTIGAGIGHVEISPTAFLVSDCYTIYLSGWGGQLNVDYSQAVYSTSSGFPVTANAFQTTTNGNNFYVGVLGQDAMTFEYGSYMGGLNSAANHVDGGTSRFDKAGRIYHAVCASCGTNLYNGFTTTPGAYSTTAPAGGYACNLAAFKFELSTIEAVVSTPNTVVCLPDPVIFNNNSANGNAFYWDFGDGTFSSDINPSHVYPGPGTYTVNLIVADTNGCFSPDSIQFDVFIGDFQGSAVQPLDTLCPGDSYQLEASGGASYEWSPAQYLDDPTSATPTATVDVTTDFMVIISDTCGVDTAYLTLPVHLGTTGISNDTSICIGNSVNLFVNGGVTFLWDPPIYLSDPTISNPVCTPDVTTTYTVEVTTSNGCVLTDTVVVSVFYTPPQPVIPDTVRVCYGSSVEISVSGADTYSWSPTTNITPIEGSVVTVNPLSDMWYYCDFTNTCGTEMDSVFVDVVAATITAGTDTIICPGQSVSLWATGGVSYAWSPSASLNSPSTSLVTATPYVPTMYTVVGTDNNGCVDSDSVFVDLFPAAFIQTSPDVYAFYGDEVQLFATSTTTGPYLWSPPEFLSCVSCENPIAIPNQNFGYMVAYYDENGCYASDSVHIYYDPIIYVPNTFTPNAEGNNDIFKAEGGNFSTFEMTIFDRWGELIFTSTDIEVGWDGTYQGNRCQDGTYIWKIRIKDLTDQDHDFVGHVNIIR